MIQIKKTILTLALLLTAVTGAWADQLASSYSSNATLNAVTVSASMEVTIATGVTVTINNGLNITSGTLTVTGPGKLVVNGAKGNNGASDWKGSNGGNGGVAISGNIIVQGGATVTATGGNGGTGGSGALEAGSGGNGGVAFAGTLTYKSGTVTANGGSAGSGGYIDDEERYASSGSAGKAFANDVDFTQTTGYSVTNGTSTIGSVLNQTKVVISGGTEPAAPSGPEVAWDEAKKTGTFTMTGGNVTLEPEYYPQATVADGGVTAADADARATTDDPLVKVDATKLTGAKKLMYFVSNSDSPAPAYDAEGWTDQLPTAEGFTQQGIVYVWYYPVGTDEGVDGATATYSDGDICLQSITARIADAPTYAVEFAEGTEESDKWKADPATGVKKGETVTVTYTGSKKVIGVKAEKKAAAAEEPVTLATPLTIEAVTAGTIRVNIDGPLETGMKYSVNGGTKTTITSTTSIEGLKAGDKVQFYGNGTQTQVYGGDTEVSIQGSGDGFQTKAYGNIMSLLDEEGFATKTDLPNTKYVFYGLFKENSTLIDASEMLLPATTLTEACYPQMFNGCTSLTTAPKLPATTLTISCYYCMFSRCTSLTSAYVKAAYIEGNDECGSIFDDCTATGAVLHTAPGSKASWENVMGTDKYWENWSVADDWEE